MGNCMSNNSQNSNHSDVTLGNSTSNDSENEGLCDQCTGLGSGACTCTRNGTCDCPPNGAPSPSCVYYSPRIMSLLEGQRTEFEAAKVHWTVVDPTFEAETESIA